MDLKIEINGASSRDIEQLLNTITPTQQLREPVQDVSSSITEQALMRQLEAMGRAIEGLTAAQQPQVLQRPHVIYSQPQLPSGPVFPALAPALDSVESARYLTQPLPQTTILEAPVEIEGYRMPAWVDKWSSAMVAAMAGVAVSLALLPWVRSLQQAPGGVKIVPPTTANPKSNNLLKGPDQKPPQSDSKVPPPPDVLKLLPAVK